MWGARSVDCTRPVCAFSSLCSRCIFSLCPLCLCGSFSHEHSRHGGQIPWSCLTGSAPSPNIFTGRTGAQIALCAHAHGHALSCSRRIPSRARACGGAPPAERWTVRPTATFDDCGKAWRNWSGAAGSMRSSTCAAVSDYQSGGIFAPGDGTASIPTAAAGRAMGRRRALADRSPTRSRATSRSCGSRWSARRSWSIGSGRGLLRVLVKFKLEAASTRRKSCR